MPTNYKQTDSRWASYPYAGEDMYHAGCGPTSVADLLDKLPTEIADWMSSNGESDIGTYACSGSGTWSQGIVAGLKAKGYSAEQLTDYSRAGVISDPVFTAFKNSIKAGNCGVLLMGGLATGCINSYWCNAGHYIAVTGYDSATDQYCVYDPAYHPRDGWHPWSDLAGCIKHVITSNVKWKADPQNQKQTQKTVTTYKFTVKQIQLGSSGKYVLYAQYILAARGLYTGSLDGDFGTKMQKAVKAYQKARGLKQDGILGAATWKDMLSLTQDANGKYIVNQVKKGDKEPEVYLLKELLKVLGDYKGSLGFTFDEKLDKAVKEWQKSEKLTQDGKAGPATWPTLIPV